MCETLFVLHLQQGTQSVTFAASSIPPHLDLHSVAFLSVSLTRLSLMGSAAQAGKAGGFTPSRAFFAMAMLSDSENRVAEKSVMNALHVNISTIHTYDCAHSANNSKPQLRRSLQMRQHRHGK